MTIDLQDFEPLERIPEGGVVSYRARSRASGVPLQVHLYRGFAVAEGDWVVSSLSRFPPAERARILDFGRGRDCVFFITQDLPGDMRFTDWADLALFPGSAPQTDSPAPHPEPVKVAETGVGDELDPFDALRAGLDDFLNAPRNSRPANPAKTLEPVMPVFAPPRPPARPERAPEAPRAVLSYAGSADPASGETDKRSRLKPMLAAMGVIFAIVLVVLAVWAFAR